MFNNFCCPSLKILYPVEGQTYSSVNETYGFSAPRVIIKIKYNGKVYSTCTSQDGYWRIPLPNVDCGDYVIYAKTRICCEAIYQNVRFGVRRYIPAPTVTSPAAGSVVTENPIIISGTVNPNYVVKINVGNAAPITVVADANGNFSYDLPKPSPDGAYAITVTQEPPFFSNCMPLPTSIDSVSQNLGFD